MAAFDREGLRNFIIEGEKASPPVFVGRTDVLADIIAISRRSWTRKGHKVPGNTRIVQGAPGAGKTSILEELRTRLESEGSVPGAPRILILNSADIDLPEDVLRPLAEKVNPDEAGDFLARYQQTRNVGTNDGLPGASLGGKLESNLARAAPAPGLTAFVGWVRNWSKGPGFSRPVIIAVDEAQRFRRDVESPLAKLFQGLHDGASDLPLTLVLAGLGDTDRRASGMGLTRGRTLHSIGRLDAAEVQEVMLGFCRHFGIEIGACEQKLMELAGPAEGWPRHIHCAQNALGRALLEVDTGGCLDAVGDWEVVQMESLGLRNQHYRQQCSQEIAGSRRLIGAIMQELVEGAMPDDVKVSIENHLHDTPGWRLPRQMDVEQFYVHLVHQGALHEDAGLTVNCPIPSFRRFLIRMGMPSPKQAGPEGTSARNAGDADTQARTDGKD